MATLALRAHDVLTDGFLLRCVVSFQQGLPRDLALLVRDVQRTNDTVPKLASRRPDAVRLLQRLQRIVHEQPVYCREKGSILCFDGLWLDALTHARLEVAMWMDHQPDLRYTGSASDVWDCVLAASHPSTMIAYVMETRGHDLRSELRPRHLLGVMRDGRVETLRALDDHALFDIVPLTVDMVVEAARFGQLEIVQYLHDTMTIDWTADVLDAAASNGRLTIVQFLDTTRSDGCTTQAMDGAAEHGHLEVVQYLHTHRTEGCTMDAMDMAAAKGHLAVVRFLHEHRDEGSSSTALNYAVYNGFPSVVSYLLQHCDARITHTTVHCALETGHRDVVRRLERHLQEVASCPKTTASSTTALSVGDFQRILRLHNQFYSATTAPRALVTAASEGRLEVVQYFHTHDHEFCTREAAVAAAEMGHVDVVQYLLEHCSASERSHAVVVAAVNSGVLEMVEYAVTACAAVADVNLSEVRELARRRGLEDIVEFLSTRMAFE